ncbi:MAG: hypothetical protein FD123_1709 [Bacteroidetes bacterium]|nr:MAG: hypothetical protein FD123_1709 [Bacteroidota bacterium]
MLFCTAIYLAKRFSERFGLDKTAVLEKLYRQALPNRFLAGFAKFIYQNQEDVFLNKLITDSFRAFFDVHICRYDRCNEYAFNCTGSIGFYFSNLLRRVAEEKGMPIGTITETPIAGLALYHFGE